MMKKNSKYYIRKAHRYLGVIIGIQLIFWTVSGLYFSWTDIDEIHGDQFLDDMPAQSAVGLMGLQEIDSGLQINSLELKFILNNPYYWVNEAQLINARTGQIKSSITKSEAVAIANEHILDKYTIRNVKYVTEVGDHHEYRGRPLPAWAIHYDNAENLIAYVSARDGGFQRVRHRDWRWFDFLWMTHTMDYQGRDNFNNWILRSFSLLGVITVFSGFLLFYVSSPSLRKVKSCLRPSRPK